MTWEDLNTTPGCPIPFGYMTGWLCVQGVGEKRVLGLANGKHEIPDNIDESNEEIRKLFEGNS